MDKYVSLIGLGAVGAPLANILYKEFKDDFVLLSSKDFLFTLKNVYVNGRKFEPKIVTNKNQLKKPIGVVFICVKNYQISGVYKLLEDMIDCDTIIFPLQNGVYSFDFLSSHFPNNVVLEGFAQGPNTKIVNNIFTYQRPGVFHIGTHNSKWESNAKNVFELMKKSGVECFYDNDIRKQVWKKLMLNVAGNAITALTEIDYCMFANSKETQILCHSVMQEYIEVAKSQNIELTETDIKEIMDYYLSFTVSKRTSMLEDIVNKRPTENEYIAGYISRLAKENNIYVPHIDTLYYLIKIKEQVYSKKV